jgi:hypothetical protein
MPSLSFEKRTWQDRERSIIAELEFSSEFVSSRVGIQIDDQIQQVQLQHQTKMSVERLSSKMRFSWQPILLLLIVFSVSANSFILAPRIRLRQSNLLAASDADGDENDTARLLRQCASERSVDAAKIICALVRLEQLPSPSIPADAITGVFELIFSSAVADLPLVGGLLGGYLPNREIITFDLANTEMTLKVETLPFLPTIDICGKNLVWNAEEATLEYTIQGKESASRWKVLFADEYVVAARSSVTGLNVIQRLST